MEQSSGARQKEKVPVGGEDSAGGTMAPKMNSTLSF